MEKLKKVLIINPYFPPLTSIASRRFGDMVKYMEENGWSPTVVTINSQGTLKVNIREEQVIRVGQFNQSKESHNKAEKIFIVSSLKKHASFLFNLRTVDRFLFTWYKQVMNNEKVLEAAQKTDLILGSFGPSASLIVAKELAAKFDKKWVADFRDLGALYNEGTEKIPRFIDRQVEKRIIKSASAMTTVSKGLAEELEKTYKKPCTVVYNGWEKNISTDKLENEEVQLPLIPRQYIYYAGTIYTHQLSAFKMVIQALGTETKLIIRTLGLKENEEILKEFSKEIGLEEKVIILPPSNPEVIKLEANAALLNLVVEDMDIAFEWKKGVLTGKLFDLMSYNPPILAVAAPKSEIKEIVEATKKGYFTSTVESTKIAIQSAVDFDQQIEIDEFSKKKQTEKLCLLFNEIIK